MIYDIFCKGEVPPEVELEIYHTRDNVGAFAFRLDGRYKLLYGNDNFFDMIGYSREFLETVMGNRCCCFLHPADLKATDRAIFAAVNSGSENVSWEARIITGSGELKLIHFSGVLVRRENYDINLYGTALDITSRFADERIRLSRYELQLSEREKIDRKAFGSALLDLTDDRLIDVKADREHILALGDAKNIDDFFKKTEYLVRKARTQTEISPRFSRRQLLSDFEKGKMSLSANYKLMTQPGRYEWVSATINMHLNPSNGHLEALFYGRTMQEEMLQQKLCDKLIETEYAFLFIVNTESGMIERMINNSDATIDIPAQGLLYSEYLSSILQNYAYVKDANDYKARLSLDFIKKKLSKKDSYSFTINLREGTSLFKQLKIRFFYIDEYEDSLAACVSDMSDYFRREKLYNERLQSALEAEKANSAKTYFLSRMSHDIRTPLNAIIGLTELATGEADDKAAVLSHLEKIKSSSTFLLDLINDILDVSVIESGKFTLYPSRYEYNDFLKAVSSVFRPQCQNKNIEFIIDHGELSKSNLPILVDKVRFNQLFFNIISNAVKYTNPGGKVWFVIENLKRQQSLYSTDFIIRDTGIGINEEFQKVLFEPFTKENASKYEIQGTGLGLSIAKAVVDAMNGSIRVDSVKDVGTTITVHLDLPVAANASDDSLETYPLEEAKNKVRGASVLLVEDHLLNNEIISRNLAKFDMKVQGAFNGLEAVNSFKNKPPHTFDVILMDIHMPIMNGLEATKKIRALDREDAKKIPIIALSANAFTEDIDLSISAGMNAHLSKPVNMELLVKTLAGYL
ncbi:MAG: response regulator [Clostridia bacterium]|nr:response regulator [Clostridia bacterium]